MPTKVARTLGKLRCQLGMHAWVEKVSAKLYYHECRRCGKQRPPYWY